MTWRTSKRVSRQRGGERRRGGGHKASFVSVLAAALAAAIKKSVDGRGWMDDGMEG